MGSTGPALSAATGSGSRSRARATSWRRSSPRRLGRARRGRGPLVQRRGAVDRRARCSNARRARRACSTPTPRRPRARRGRHPPESAVARAARAGWRCPTSATSTPSRWRARSRTGTHGTGTRLPNLSGRWRVVELILRRRPASGRSPAATSCSAARVSPGRARRDRGGHAALRCPRSASHIDDRPEPLEDVLEELQARADAHDHFEFWTFPHATSRSSRTLDRTDDPPTRLEPGARPRRGDVLMDNHAFRALNEVAKRFPGTIPRLNRFASAVASQRERVDWSLRDLRLRAARALRGDGVRRLRASTPWPPCARPARRSSATRSASRSSCASPRATTRCSPAHGRGQRVRRRARLPGDGVRAGRSAEVEAALGRARRAPALGQALVPQAPTDFARRYPRWDDFQASARELDPGGPLRQRVGPRRAGMSAMKTLQHLRRPPSTYDPDGPRGLPRAACDRFGPKIGAVEASAATVYELPPGQALCPYHYESDEEWMLVLLRRAQRRAIPEGDGRAQGAVTPPRFLVGPTGAHKMFNALRPRRCADPGCSPPRRSRRTPSTRTPTRSGSGTADRARARRSRGWARVSTTTTANYFLRGRSCPRRGRSGTVSTTAPLRRRCTTSKRSHSSPALAWRNHTRSPTPAARRPPCPPTAFGTSPAPSRASSLRPAGSNGRGSRSRPGRSEAGTAAERGREFRRGLAHHRQHEQRGGPRLEGAISNT